MQLLICALVFTYANRWFSDVVAHLTDKNSINEDQYFAFDVFLPGERGHILWTGDWIPFIDAMMQMTILTRPGTSLQLPTELSSVMINPEVHSTRLWDWSATEKGNKPLTLLQLDLF